MSRTGMTDGLINQQIHADMTFFETQSSGAVFHRLDRIRRIVRSPELQQSDSAVDVECAATVRRRGGLPPSPSPCGRGLGGGGAARWAQPPPPTPPGARTLVLPLLRSPRSQLREILLAEFLRATSALPTARTSSSRRSSTRRILPDIVFGKSANPPPHALERRECLAQVSERSTTPSHDLACC